MSSKNQKKQGRGLSSLFENVEKVFEINEPEADSSKSELVRNVDISTIKPNDLQPRKTFDKESIAELADSIREFGFINPIVVYQISDTDATIEYRIIAGERRYRAALKLGIQTIPVVLRSVSDLKIINAIALIENVQREDLNPVEEANCIKSLIEEYECNHEFIAKKIGKSRSYVTNILRLLSLPEEVLQDIRESRLSPAHARVIVGNDDPKRHAKYIKDNKLSVREAERYIKNLEHEKSPKHLALPSNANDNGDNKLLQENVSICRGGSYEKFGDTLKYDGKYRYQLLNQSLEGDLTGIEENLKKEIHMNVRIVDRKSAADLIITFNSIEQLDFLIQKLSSGTSFA